MLTQNSLNTIVNTALVFPGTSIEGLVFSDLYRNNGWHVIGAASVDCDGFKFFYDSWIDLPFVYETHFLEELCSLIKTRNIRKIFTAHEVMKHFLLSTVSIRFPDTELEFFESTSGSESFRQLCLQNFFSYKGLAKELGVLDRLTEKEYFALAHRAFQMRGESGLKKLTFMMAAAGICPQGDVVELGVLSGRSAFVLGWLARRYRVGSVLCIDPWSPKDGAQEDSPKVLQNAFHRVNFDRFFDEFLLNLVPSFHSAFNYLRKTSSMVRPHFCENLKVSSKEFGVTSYCGKISLLHIDGNHDYSVVSDDITQWWSLVLPGGWIVIDDYEWPFGNGPKRAADELIAKNPNVFSAVSVCDGALFLRLA